MDSVQAQIDPFSWSGGVDVMGMLHEGQPGGAGCPSPRGPGRHYGARAFLVPVRAGRS